MNRPLMLLISSAFLASVVALAKPVRADKCPDDDVGYRQMKFLNYHSRWADMNALFVEWTTLKCIDLGSVDDRHSVVFAAHASKGLGDIGTAIQRAERVPYSTTLHKELPAQYGKVNLDFRNAPAPRTLVRTSSGPSINPAAITHVAQALNSVGKVHNYLPPGTYTLSSKTFTVVAGQSLSLSY